MSDNRRLPLHDRHCRLRSRHRRAGSPTTGGLAHHRQHHQRLLVAPKPAERCLVASWPWLWSPVAVSPVELLHAVVMADQGKAAGDALGSLVTWRLVALSTSTVLAGLVAYRLVRQWQEGIGHDEDRSGNNAHTAAASASAATAEHRRAAARTADDGDLTRTPSGSIEPPSEFICPITKDLMQKPMFTSDGHTYEQDAIREWLRGHNTSPRTGEPLPDKVLRPNHALRAQIVDFRERHGLPPAQPWDPNPETVPTTNPTRAAQANGQQGQALNLQGITEVLRCSASHMAQAENLLQLAGGRRHQPRDVAARLQRNPRACQQVMAMVTANADVSQLFLRGVGQGAMLAHAPPLVRATHEGNVRAVEQLLGQGTGVAAVVENTPHAVDGRTLLHCAAWANHAAIVRLLLSKGVDPNICDASRGTALHIAAFMGHLDVAKALVENGANLEARSQGGSTPLHRACVEGHTEIVQYLLLQHADVLSVREDGTTTLHQAAYRGHLNTCQLLLIQSKGRKLLEALDITGSPPLHCAATSGSVEVVRLLLSKDADPTIAAKSGDTALHRAVWHGNVEVASLLLDAGVDVNVSRPDGLSLLHIAASRDDVVLVKALLERGADMSKQNADGFSPLHSATWFSRISCALELINAGAPTELQSSNHSTALHFACWNGHAQVVRALLAKGANVFAQTKDGDTALHQAAFHCHTSCVVLLLERFGEELMPESAARPTLSSTRAPRRKFIDAQKLDGSTALHLAAGLGHLAAVDSLLSYGADPTIEKCGGLQALELARRVNAAPVVNRLQAAVDMHQQQ